MVISGKNYPLNAFRICADEITDDVKGRVVTPLKSENIFFSGMGELLLKMDELFDSVGYPQAFQDKRSFGNDKEQSNLYRGIPQGERESSDIIRQTGKQRTIDVVVNARRNASWQGSVYAADGIYITDFDGELELLASVIRHAQME